MFVKLVNTSISTSWLILAVIVLRVLLKKVPKAMDCALWGLVAIRLMCPFSITSSLSLIPNAETIPESALYMEASAQSDHIAVDVVTNPALPEIADMEVNTTVRQAQDFDMYGTLIWVAGMVLILLYAMASYLRLRWKVSASIRTKEKIWICDQVDSPFILGILRPRIYLPSSMEERQFSYVVAHEQAHLKRRDHWWKPLGFVLLAVYWFNPLIWIAYILLCRDIEMACDEKVVRDMGIQEKKQYSEALLSYSTTYRMISACPLAFGEVGVKERVKAVLNYKKPVFWVITVSVFICAVLAVCFLTDPAEESENPGEANAVSSLNDTEEAKHDYSEIRVNHIFETFNMPPEQYTFAWFYELLDYVETDDYTYILSAMGIQPGSTSPSFFIGDDILFCVCQDPDAVNYLYEFTKSEDGMWELSETRQLQDIGRYQDVYQSFSEYTKDKHISYLAAEDFKNPVGIAEKLLLQAFSFDTTGTSPVVSQNGDFWNIAYTDGDTNYIVEISGKLPYPQTLYQFRKASTDGLEGTQKPLEGEFAAIAQEFLYNVYCIDCDDARTEVYTYGNKVSVQFALSDDEIFHVRINTDDMKPSGVLFFNNMETAQLAMEKAGAVAEDIHNSEKS